MLETVKAMISELPDKPFGMLYQEYICDVQDYSMGQEVQSISNADILAVNRLLNKMYKELM